MKKALVIGAGRRAHCVVFPALHCLGDMIEVVGIHTRSPRHIRLFNGAWDYQTIQDIGSIDFASLDIIIVAIPPGEVPGVLKKLASFDTRNIVLMLDTPVLPLSHISSMRRFKTFKRVLVAEDLLGFPTFVLARKLIDEGLIGDIRHIHFFHSGFKYHALAVMKWLSRSRSVRWACSRNIAGEIRYKTFGFPGRIRVSMLEPRDYEIGRWFMAGTKGSLSDYSLRYSSAHSIDYIVESGRYTGLALDGVPVEQTGLDRLYSDRIRDNQYEISVTNDLKIRGYMELVHASFQDQSLFHYYPIDGIYDALSIKLIDKLGYFLDPGSRGVSLLRFFLKLLSLTPRR